MPSTNDLPESTSEVVVVMMSALRCVVARLGRLAEKYQHRRTAEGQLAAAKTQLTEEHQQRKAADKNDGARSGSPPPGPFAPFQQLFSKPGELISLLTLFGFILYGLVWLCYSRFYEALGLDPDDVGLNFISVLSRAAVGTVVLIVIGLVVLTIAALFPSFSDITPHGSSTFTRLLRVYGAALVFVVSAVIYGRLSDTLTSWVVDLLLSPAGRFGSGLVNTLMEILAALIVFLASVLPFILVYIARRRRYFHSVLARLFNDETRRAVGQTALVLLTLIIVLAIPYFGGSRFAATVREKAERGMIAKVAATWLLDIQAQDVEAKWIRPISDLEALKNPRYVYLGQAGEVTILLETTQDKVYRVPSSSVVLSIKPK
jgi:hypothetical protein